MKPDMKRNKKLINRYSHKHCPTVISLLRQSAMFQQESMPEPKEHAREGNRWELAISKGTVDHNTCTEREVRARYTT
jgi:hypothetical protein